MENRSDCWYKRVCALTCEELPTCIRYTEMKYLMENSGIPISKQKPISLDAPGCDYDAFCKLRDIKNDIVDYVEVGSNIYIGSRCTGNGKTTWATKLLLKYFDSIWSGNGFRVRGKFIHVPTFLLKCKDFENHDAEYTELKEHLTNCDVVVWDDIASTDISAYDYSQLLMYIDQRVLDGKANIFTGNYADRESLSKRIGAKLTSRIWNSESQIIIFNGGDMR